MKIVFDARLISASGIGRYAANLLQFAAPVSGHDWTFMVHKADRARIESFKIPGAKFIETEIPTLSVSEQTSLASLVPKQRDVFWSPHWNLPFALGGRRMATVHDVFHLERKKRIPTLKQYVSALPYFQSMKWHGDLILTGSKFSEDRLQYFGFRDIVRIPYFLELTPSFQRTKPTSNRPYFIFISILKPHKNLGMLIRAFEKFNAVKSGEADLVVVGRADHLQSPDAAIVEALNGGIGNVVFKSNLDRDVLLNLIANAEALACPSLYEGFGLPVLEAMQLGTPVICADIPPLKEVAEDAACYFDPRDADSIVHAMNQVYRNPTRQATMRAQGIVAAEKYNRAEVLKIYESFFQNLPSLLADKRS